MSIKNQKPAILLFARSSEEELKHKYVKAGIGLFDFFTQNTLKEVDKTGLAYRVYTEEEQQGDSFGERFANAIEDMFNSGYEKIITIGNDSPDLKASDILLASHNLTTNDLVIGPSMDGGIYLMGIHQESYSRTTFLNLPWQTSGLATALYESIEGNSLKLRRMLKDVDSQKDLRSFLSTTKIAFKRMLSMVFSVPFLPTFYRTGTISSFTLSHPFNKGSPVLI